jgi:hypothetical protein
MFTMVQRFSILLSIATLAFAAAPAAAPASSHTVTLHSTGTAQQAFGPPALRESRFGGFRGYRGYRRPTYGSRYRYHRGHPFLRGLFFGWLLSHLFGGGFPIFPFLMLGLLFLMLRRRRRAVYRPW